MAAVFQTQLKLLILMQPVINESGTGKDLATFHLLSYFFLSFLSFFLSSSFRLFHFIYLVQRIFCLDFFYKLVRHYTNIQRVR